MVIAATMLVLSREILWIIHNDAVPAKIFSTKNRSGGSTRVTPKNSVAIGVSAVRVMLSRARRVTPWRGVRMKPPSASPVALCW